MKKIKLISANKILINEEGNVKLIVRQPYLMFKGRGKTVLNFNSINEFDIYWKNNIKKELERIKGEEDEQQDTSIR